MNVKYIPRKNAGRDVGIEGRVLALMGLVSLIATSPIYVSSKGISRARDCITGRKKDITPDFDEFADTLKLCYYTAMYGKLPEKN